MANYPELSGKVAVLSGAGGNLGTAVVQRLSAEGMRLALIDRSEDRMREAIAKFNLPAGTETLPLGADLTRKADVEALIAKARTHFGKIDAVVNIAGGWRPGKPVFDLDEENWNFMHDLNARSVFLMSGAAAKAMLEQGGSGRIVTIAARSGLHGDPGNSANSAAKSSAIRLTESLAAEMIAHGASGVTVNVILPSTIDTPQNRQGDSGADFSRWVAPDSLAATIAFLLSDGARDITGAAIPVYGRS